MNPDSLRAAEAYLILGFEDCHNTQASLKITALPTFPPCKIRF